MLDVNELKEILDIILELTAEKDENKVLEKILDTAMHIIRCDAGTLYLVKDNALIFTILKKYSRDIYKSFDGDHIDLPEIGMDDRNICSYCAVHRCLINIPDVYSDEFYDLSATKRYDKRLGYKSKSMLLLPLENSKNELVGVLQLINAMDEWGNVIPFKADDEYVIRIVGSMAAVAVSNMMYVDEMQQLLESFVCAFTTAIDARTPYNASHSKKVTKYAELIADEINRQHDAGECEDYFTKERKMQLVMAAALHDIGKMVVPLSVMNKATRLAGGIRFIRNRFELITAYHEIDYLKGRITKEQYLEAKQYLKKSLQFIREFNRADFVDDDQIEKIREIASKTYEKEDGVRMHYLTSYEERCLCINRGTLTDEERRTMEGHVVMTGRILEKVHFNSQYSDVRKFAIAHHELLDGSGYPNHLTAEDLELEPRILAIVDIYDALTSPDRPYKEPVGKEEAFAILREMADEGKLEGRLVECLYNVI